MCPDAPSDATVKWLCIAAAVSLSLTIGFGGGLVFVAWLINAG